MLASLHPSSPTSDQAVKDLLDQRARASHTRYTSVSFSQRSDSPSIYSRGDITPNPVYAPLGELPSRPGHPGSVAAQAAFYNAEENFQRPSSVVDSLESTDRYMPAFEDDNDGTSFIEVPTPRPVSRQEPYTSDVLGPENDSPSMEKMGEDSRMSLLGPKMRFVSRAPWETGEDELLEDDEELATSPDGLSIFGGKMGGWRGKDTDKASVKGLSLATFRSRSPGPPPASIKKGGFGLHRHKTPEPSSETPYGAHIPNASQSHSAVTTLSSGRSSHSVTDSQSSHVLSYKAPIPRVASGRISPMLQGNVIPPLPSPRPFRTSKHSFSSQDGSSSSSFRSDSPPPPVPFTHPYANPDLVPPMGPPPAMPLPRTPRKSRDHSSEQDDRRSSPLRPKSASPQSSPRPIKLRKASAGAKVLPTPSFWNVDDDDYERETKHLFSDGQPRESVASTKSTPSYPESKDSPMRNLISLEQARVLAQTPSRLSQGANSMSPRSTPTSTLVAGLGLAPGVVENGVVRGQAHRSIPFPPSDPAPQSQNQHHQRQRTMSSGRHIISGGSTTPRPDGDTVPTKNLKHKKSAFLKLFQGGKDKEREKEALSASRQSVNRAMSTPPQLVSSYQPMPPLPGVQNFKRIPPPQLSVVVTSPSVGHSDSLSGTIPDLATRPASPPRLRQASSPFPSSSDHKAQESSGQDQQRHLDQPSRSAQFASSSSSAPPSQTEFKTLSLRPISTMFSANFPELLSASSPQSNQPAGWNQNQGNSSPATPGLDPSRSNSMSTASDYPVTPSSAKPFPSVPGIISSPAEDQSVFIAALQEQIINSRKTWQRQIWELEGQIKDLKSEVEELRNTGECETCGKAKRDGRLRTQAAQRYGVVDRPRPRMGGGTRSVFGGGNDM